MPTPEMDTSAAKAEQVAAAINDARSRRSALVQMGLQAAGVASAVAAGVALMPKKVEAQTLTDPTILNFALNLEYLEAEFYLRAATGSGLPASAVTGVGTQGTVTGGSQVPFVSTAIAQYAQLLAVDELTHVQFLRTVLGTAAVAEPNINLSTSFTQLAIAAGLITSGQTFSPFASDVAFLLGAFIFEDVGVTAYAGAAQYLTSPTNITAAAGILATEAYHGGAIRSLIANIGGGASANLISTLRATLSGGGNDQGIIIQGDNYNFASTDSNALVFRRTTSQVLSIVYGGPSTGGGLFFPNGTNGAIS